MTIETLMHIYNLMQKDLQEKEAAYKAIKNYEREWDKDHEDSDEPNPYTEEARVKNHQHTDSMNAWREFTAKEWN